jgi:hypothetical protein
MREAYRLNKQILVQQDSHVMVAFNYMDKQKQPYTLIDKAMRKALQKINKDLAQQA